MSRWYNDDPDWSESRQILWDNAIRRATQSKRGQAVLRELEAALLALPEPRLIEGFLSDGKNVCTVGALAAYRQVQSGLTWEEAMAVLDETGSYDVNDVYDRPSIDETARFAESRLKMAFSLAWDLAYDNDVGCEGITPEERYTAVLRWVRARIIKEPATA